MAFDFPDSPTEWQTFSPSGGPTYVYRAPGWELQPGAANAVLYVSQSLLAAEQEQARGNIDASPFGAMAGRNIIMNSCGLINQEYGEMYYGQNWIGGAGWYFCDQWKLSSPVATPGSISFGIGTVANPFPDQLPGFSSSIAMGVYGAALTSPGANDYVSIYQPIERWRMAHLGLGTADAVPVTISFWVLSSKAGTMCVGLAGGGGSGRCYIGEVVINATFVWEYKTLTIPGDTVATGWDVANNAVGAWFWFNLAAGASMNDATPNSWQAWTDDATAAQTNFFTSISNTVYLTGITMTAGSKAPTAAESKTMQRLSYSEELRELQRHYYRYTRSDGSSVCSGMMQSTTLPVGVMRFPVKMRTTPSLAIGGNWSANLHGTPTAISGISTNFATDTACQIYGVSAAAYSVGDAVRMETGGPPGGWFAASARL